MEAIITAIPKYCGFASESILQLIFFGYSIYLRSDALGELNDIKEYRCSDDLKQLIEKICVLNIIICLLDILLQFFNICFLTNLKEYSNSILKYYLKKKLISYFIVIPFIICFLISVALLLNESFSKEQSLFCQNKLYSQYQINKITLIVNTLKMVFFAAYFFFRIYCYQKIEKIKAICNYIFCGLCFEEIMDYLD